MIFLAQLAQIERERLEILASGDLNPHAGRILCLFFCLSLCLGLGFRFGLFSLSFYLGLRSRFASAAAFAFAAACSACLFCAWMRATSAKSTGATAGFLSASGTVNWLMISARLRLSASVCPAPCVYTAATVIGGPAGECTALACSGRDGTIAGCIGCVCTLP